jgi:hypothetical protein
MNPRRLLRALFPLVMSVTACATAETHPLVKRASFDLDCPREKLVWRKFDDQTYGVQGCGQKATYIESCQGLYEPCVWVRNR